jgi:hypothetical protein
VTIYFDAASYAQLRIFSSPAGWDALVVASDANFPTPVNGFYDVLALSAGILPGFSQGVLSFASAGSAMARLGRNVLLW